LPVEGEEWFDIAYLDPLKATHIRICYARDESDAGVFINFGGLVDKCPYLIEVEATSDDCHPERIQIEHFVEEDRLVFGRAPNRDGISVHKSTSKAAIFRWAKRLK
jgi:hypothetical protein